MQCSGDVEYGTCVGEVGRLDGVVTPSQPLMMRHEYDREDNNPDDVALKRFIGAREIDSGRTVSLETVLQVSSSTHRVNYHHKW